MNKEQLYRYISERLDILSARNRSQAVSGSPDGVIESAKIHGAIDELNTLRSMIATMPWGEKKGEPEWLSQALNEGNGVYRP